MAEGAVRASNPIRIDGGSFEVDARYLAEQFRLGDPAEVTAFLRNGRMLALCERGEQEDAGRYRLTFRLGASRLSLIVDAAGRIIRHSSILWPMNERA